MSKRIRKKKFMVSLFSGCGGMSLGFERTGFESVLAIENWKPACDTYGANFPKAKVLHEDIAGISKRMLKKIINSKKIELIIGGPPCQGFSIAGKRGLKDPRNSLFKEFIRVVDIVRPAYFVMENVRGLSSMKTKKGERVVDIIYKEFEKIGYRVKYRILNAADYGVPQERHRIFFIGTNTDTEIIFPPINVLLGDNKTVRDAIGDLEPLESGEKSKKDKWHFSFNHPKHQIEWMKCVPEGGTAHDNPNPKNRPTSGFRTTYKRIWWDRPAPAVTTCFGAISSQNNVHPRDTRALTIREAARLQTFPDSFKWRGNVNQIRIQIGNAVPPLLAENVGRVVYRSLETIAGRKRKDKFTKEKRSEIMSKIGSKDTDIEILLKGILKKRKIKYSKKKLPGSPDVVLKGSKVAIFCDGDFWHGRNFKKISPRLDGYWRNKIERNMKRDRRCDRELGKKGWKALRFWGSDIAKKPEACIRKIEKAIEEVASA